MYGRSIISYLSEMREEASNAYWQTLNKMTPDQKMNAFLNLYWTARELKAAGVRAMNPNWTEEQIQKEVRNIFLYATD